MGQKVKFNVAVDGEIVERFRQVAEAYDNRLGMCLTAAMLEFIEADPKEQGALLTRCFEAEIHGQVRDLIEQAKSEQTRRIHAREKRDRSKD
jgi:hypothetical protein